MENSSLGSSEAKISWGGTWEIFRDDDNIFHINEGQDDTGSHTCQNLVNIHLKFVHFIVLILRRHKKL